MSLVLQARDESRTLGCDANYHCSFFHRVERLVKVGEVECLEIAAKIYIKKLSPPRPEGLQMKRFFGSIRFSGKLPIDPALGHLEEMLDLSVEFTAEGVPPALGRPVTLNSISTVKRTAQMSYLK